MTDEQKVAPLSSGTEEVSSDTTTGGAAAPATGSVQETPASPPRRGRGVDLSSLSPEQLKAHKKAIEAKSYRKRAAGKKAASYVFNSKDEPTKNDAKALLAAR